MKITLKSTIGEVINKHPAAAQIFLKYGLHCIYCPMAQMETIEEAATAHPGLDIKKLVGELNVAVKK